MNAYFRGLLVFIATLFSFSFSFGQVPTISGFSPVSGPVGTDVTITGTNFSTTASDNIVYFGPVRTVASASTSTTLTVKVPNYASSVNPVSVTNLATNLSADSWTSTTPRFRVTYSGGSISASSFNLTEITSISAYAFDVADFNNDGGLDIVVGNNSGSQFFIYYNDLAGGFQTPTTFVGPNNIFDIVAVDVNNDGHMDLGISHDSQLSIQISDGAGGFNDGSTFTPSAGGGIRCFAIGDINEDGNWDILSGMTSRDAVWAEGDGLGGFTYSHISARTTESVVGIDIADMDKDGHLDIVGANFTSSAAESNLNNGAGSFSRTALNVGFQPSSVAIGDFNNDGDFDIAAAPQSTANIGLVLGNGDGTYQTATSRPVGSIPKGIIAGDMNGDGNDDLIAIQSTANPQILIGSGSNTFTQLNIAGGDGVGDSSKPKIADFNGDGKPDFVTAVSIATKLQIFTQKTVAPTSQASAITFSNIGASQMGLNWANGNGTKRIVVASTSAVSWTPTNSTSYTSNSTFGAGANLGSNTFVVYNGAGSSFTVDGLTQATDYHFRVFEYDGASGSELYYSPTATGNPNSQKTYAPFISTWKPTDTSITIPTTGSGYNYDVYWVNEGDATDFGSLSSQTGDAVINGLVSGDTYRVEISGDFPRIHFDNTLGGDEILTIEQWGDIAWTSFAQAFYGCSELTVPATDAPDLTGVTSLNSMFFDASKFDNAINHWVVNTIEDFSSMFFGATLFDQPLDNWVVTAAEDMSDMFNNADAFNQNLNTWTPVNVINMRYMFYSADDFNGSVGSWAVTKVEDMSRMFSLATSFNQPLAGWGSSTGAVTNMSGMFGSASAFNQDLGDWDVSQVTNMSNMFDAASIYNNNGQPLDWNTQTGELQNMNLMFRNATAFNQDLSAWDVSKVLYMDNTFENATAFDQSLANWDIGLVTTMNNMLRLSGLSQANYDATLIGWLDDNGATETIPSDISLGAAGLTYCEAATAHAELQNASTHNWSITDFGQDCPFVTTWKPTDTSITIPTTGSGYNYDVYWVNGGDPSDFGSSLGNGGNVTITGLTSGDTYEVKINGDFPRIYFNNTAGSDELQTIEHWGDISWTSMEYAFYGCSNLAGTTADSPDLSSVTSLWAMFFGASQFDQDISDWDVSQIQAMNTMFYNAAAFNNGGQPLDWANTDNLETTGYMFYGATAFDQDISSWNVDNVTSMTAMFQNAANFNNGDAPIWSPIGVTDTGFAQMFSGANKFNQDVSGWVVSNVTSLSSMFNNATAFNNAAQSLDWGSQTAGVTNMSYMFNGATAFDQDISGWHVSAVTTMSQMFTSASAFDQNLGAWDVGLVTNMNNMLSNSGLSTANYDATLIGWLDDNGATETIPSGVSLGAAGLTYCQAAAARSTLVNAPHNWTITDAGPSCSAPTTPASAIVISNITPTTMTLNWTNGDGTQRLVVVREGSLPTGPFDGTEYSASSVFGSGDDINSGSYVVYNGTGTSVTVTGLTSSKTYYYHVFEYHGTGIASTYNANTTTDNPTSQSTNENNGNAPGTAGLHFDGVDDYVNVGNVPELKFAGTANYTISTWIKVEAHTGSLAIATSFRSGSNSSWETLIDATNKIIAYRHHTPYSIVSNASINVGEWTHVATTYDGTNLSIFINGVLDNTAVFSGSLTTGPDVLFGARYDNTGNPELFFKGQMDEMQIWNTARSAAEIQADMYTSLPTDVNLIGHWNFDDDLTVSNPTTASDLSGNGYDGTLVNTPSWTHRVTHTNDTGTGSLRDAITIADTDTDKDFIDFSISGTAPHTIQPVTALPSISRGVILDASTQSGIGNFRIVLDGQGSISNGFRLNGSTSEVYGFYISGFSTGIYMGNPGGGFIIGAPSKGNTIVNNSSNGIFGLAAADCIIQSNYIGTDEAGNTGLGNGSGLDFSTGANRQIIGGDDPSERNIISGNNRGIATNASSTYQIKGNYIGTDPTGTTAIPNTTGIAFGTGSNHIVQNNVISGNSGTAISLNQTSTNTIQGNYIGVAADGTTALGNQTGINTVASGNVNNNIIGGLNAGEANIIANSSGNVAQFHGANIDGNQLIGNSIYCNAGGISLDGLGNNNIQPPIINQVSSTSASGTGTDGDQIHVYRDNSGCSPPQGQEYLGMTTVASGTWQVSGLTIAVSTDVITATATNALDGTSDFSTQELFVVTHTSDNGGGSLRWCIDNANASTGETISFNLAGSGPWVITPATELPALSTTTIIDASTQPSWSSSNLVQIDGTSIKDETGFSINANDCEIYGFEITGFNENGGEAIVIANTVVGGQIGDATRGNVIGDNHTGIDLRGSNVVVQGNKIGTNSDGNTANPNEIGLLMSDGGSGNSIGGSATGEGNIISANTSAGITLRNTTDHEIKGNRIGVGLDDSPLGNLVGINISTFGGVSEDIVIGGLLANEGNIIAYNERVNSIAVAGGVYIESPTIASGLPIVTGVTMRGNAFFCNSPQGIIFTNDANNGIVAPVITGFSATEVSGTCGTCSTGDQIDIYRDNSTCEPAQGDEYLGTVTYSSDPWTFTTTGLSLTDKITATVTDSDGNTSRFHVFTIAEIAVYEGTDDTGTPIVDRQATEIDFNTAVQPADIQVEIAIVNSGTAPLNVSDMTADLASFTLSGPTTPFSIAPGGTEVVVITLDGATTGTFNANIVLTNDDDDEGSFTFPVTGMITPTSVPEIAVLAGSTNLTSADNVDFGSAVQPTGLSQTFTINNTGTADLNISALSLTTGSAFSISGITLPATVAASGSTTFTIDLDGTTVGAFTDVLTIANDDTDESSFVVNLAGVITSSSPQLAVSHGSITLTHGQTDVVDTGTADMEGTLELILTLANIGNQTLTINNISLDGNLNGLVSTSLPTTIGAAADQVVTIALSTLVHGSFTGHIHISSDDPSQSTFTIPISYTVSPPLLEIMLDGSVLIPNSVIDFGETPRQEPVQKIFEISNTFQNLDLEIEDVIVDHTAFEVVEFPSTISAGGSGSLIINLTSQTEGTFEASLVVISNLEDFELTLEGEVTPRNQEIHVYNVVTPNGDGIHDFLQIERITEYPDNQVSIVDRWGRTVFSESHYDNDKVVFDGRRQGNGEQLPAGTYYYVILTGSDKKTGFIQLSTDN